MKRKNKGQTLAVPLLVLALSILTASSVASGAEYTVTVSADPATIAVGEVSTVTADWATTRNGTTFYQWYVDDVAVGTPVQFTVSASTPKSGSETYYFTGASVGDHVITFAIWHDSYPAQAERYGEGSATVTVTGAAEGEWRTETAFGGDTAGADSPWWYYFDTTGNETQFIWAGQHEKAGTVTVSEAGDGNMTIAIHLTDGWQLQDDDEAVKIQGCNDGDLPSSRLPAGHFTTYKGSDLTVEVGAFDYFIIQLDVRIWVPE